MQGLFFVGCDYRTQFSALVFEKNLLEMVKNGICLAGASKPIALLQKFVP